MVSETPRLSLRYGLVDEWDCLCNDRCPTCDAEIEPDAHEAIQGTKSAKIRTLNDCFRKSLTADAS